MQRITITLDDELADQARAEVTAGEAPSMSAYIATAVRDRQAARRELLADLRQTATTDPYDDATISELARLEGIDEAEVRATLDVDDTGRPRQ